MSLSLSKSISRGGGTRLLAATAVVAAMVISPVAGIISSADDAIVKELSLTVVGDGTAPFDAEAGPGKDDGEHNGVVRTHDTITYNWEYRNEARGDITLTQTLPEGASWDPASAGTCNNIKTAFTNNGRTFTCILKDVEPGRSSMDVKAIVNQMANGSIISQTVSAGGKTSDPVTTTVSAIPSFKISNFYMTPGQRRGTTDARYEYIAVLGIYTKLSVADYKPLGLESVKKFSYKLDLSEFPRSLAGFTCSNRGTSASEAVYPGNNGQCTVDYDSGSGIATVTATDPDWSGTEMARKTLDERPVGPSYTGINRYAIKFHLPATDLPEQSSRPRVRFYDAETITLGGTPLDDESMTKDYTSTTNIFGVNESRFTSNPIRRIKPIADNGKATGLVPLRTGWYPENPVLPGENIRYTNYIYNAGNVEEENTGACTYWRTNQLTWTGNVHAYATDKIINPVYEYYNLPINSNEEITNFSCGTFGEGDGWYPSIEAAGGVDKVTAVRFKSSETLPPGNNLMFMNQLKRKENLPTGEVVSVVEQFHTNERGWWGGEPGRLKIDGRATNDQWNYVATWVAADALIRGDWTSTPSAVVPGAEAEFSFTPEIVSPFLESGVARATNASVKLTLPGCLTIVGDPTAPVSVTGVGGKETCASEGQTITWPLGDLTESNARELKFKADTSFNASDVPFTAKLNAIVKSDSDVSPEDLRTISSDAFAIQSLKQFGITQTVEPATVVEPTGNIKSTVSWRNASGSALTKASFVQVLPYKGDDHGSTVDTVLVEAPTSESATVQVTTDSAAVVKAALELDPTGETGINWTSPSSDLSQVTTVRYVLGEVPDGTAGLGNMIFQPKEYTVGGEIKPALDSVTYVSSDAPDTTAKFKNFAARSLHIVGYKTLSGSVRLVDSPAGSASPAAKGVEAKLNGYTFGVNGVDDSGSGDDQAILERSADLAANGKYSFGEVLAGKYTVSVTAPSGYENVVGSVEKTVEAEPAEVAIDDLTMKALPASVVVNVVSDSSSAARPIDMPEHINVVLTGKAVGADGVLDTSDDVEVNVTKQTTNGTYTFGDLAAGKYTVKLGDLPDYVTAGTASADAEVAADGSVTKTLTVVLPSAEYSVSGSVTMAAIPANSATPHAAGVKVKAKSDSVEKEVAVGDNGAYTLSELAPGTYTISAVVPAGYEAVTEAKTQEITVGGENPTGVDFEVKALPSTVSGTVTKSTKSAEPSIALPEGINVVLTGKAFGPDGVKSADDVAIEELSTKTNGAGEYSFTGLAAGEYTVAFGELPGFVKADPDAATHTVTVPVNQTVTVDPLSVILPSSVQSISGTVSLTDSPVGSVDPKPAGVKVTLSGYKFGPDGADNNGAGDDEAVTIADQVLENGNVYLFSDLGPGKYTVETVVPAGYEAVTGPQENTITLGGDAITGVDFQVKALPSTVAGSVVPSDQSQNNPIALPEVEVVLTGYGFGADGINNRGTGDDENITKKMVTTKGGKYSFGDLPAGNYTVEFGDLPSDVTPDANNQTVSVAAGATGTPGNLSLILPSREGSIGGMVTMVDSPANSASPAGAGVKVEIVKDGQKTEAVVTENGTYEFADVAPGTYTVSVVVPDGYEVVGDDSVEREVVVGRATTAADFQVKAKPATVTGTITATDDSPAGHIDVPSPLKVAIIGYAFGPNGADDNGETGDVPFGKVVEAVDGSFTIEGLPAGKYTVSVLGLPSHIKGVVTSHELTLTPGSSETADMTLRLPAATNSISGAVTLSSDSPAGSASPAAAGVKVKIKGDGVDETLELSDTGTYTKAGLQPGTYTVSTVVGDSGYIAVTGPKTPTITLGGKAVTDVDFTVKAPASTLVASVKSASSGANTVAMPKSFNVKLEGYAFGPNGRDDQGEGDDVAINALYGSTLGGTYSFTGLAKGSYTVSFNEPLPANTKADVASVSALVSAVGTTTSADPLTVILANNLHAISGVVTLSEDTPANSITPHNAGVKVKLEGYTFGPNGLDDHDSGDDVAYAASEVVVAEDGSYSFGELEAGRYTVSTVVPNDNYESVTKAQSFTFVTGSDDKAGVDFQVKVLPSSITVVISDDGSQPDPIDMPTSLDVVLSGTAYGADGVEGGGDDVPVSAVNGVARVKAGAVGGAGSKVLTYEFAGLAAGKYSVAFKDLPNGIVAKTVVTDRALAVNENIEDAAMSVILPPRPVNDSGIPSNDPGNTVKADKDGIVTVTDKNGDPVKDAEGNPVVIGGDNGYKTDFVDGKMTVVDGEGNPVMGKDDRPVTIGDGEGNTVKVGDNGKVMVVDKEGNPVNDKKTGEPVEIGGESGHETAVINGTTTVVDEYGDPVIGENDKPVTIGKDNTPPSNDSGIPSDDKGNTVKADPDGSVTVTDKNGDPVKDAEGNPVVIGGDSGNKTKVIDGKTTVVDENGDPVKGKDDRPVTIGDGEDGDTVKVGDNGKVIVVDKDGNPVNDKEGNPVEIGGDSGNKTEVIGGTTTVIDNESGKPVIGENDKPVTIGKDNTPPSNDSGIPSNDNGNTVKTDNDGNVVVVDKTGNLVKDGEGNPVIIGGKDGYKTMVDPETGKTTVIDRTGKVVTGKDGKPVTIGEPGKGNTVKVIEKGQVVVVTPKGEVINDEDGNPVTIGGKDGNKTMVEDGKTYVVKPDGKTKVVSDKGRFVTIGSAAGLPGGNPGEGSGTGEGEGSGSEGGTGGAVDGVDSAIPSDDSGNTVKVGDDGTVTVVDKNGDPVKDAEGNPVTIGGADGNKTVKDPDTGKTTVVDPDGNPVKGKDGKPVTIGDPEDGNTVKVDDDGTVTVVDKDGNTVNDKEGNPVEVGGDSGNKTKVIDGTTTVVDKESGDPVIDEDGNPVTIGPGATTGSGGDNDSDTGVPGSGTGTLPGDNDNGSGNTGGNTGGTTGGNTGGTDGGNNGGATGGTTDGATNGGTTGGNTGGTTGGNNGGNTGGEGTGNGSEGGNTTVTDPDSGKTTVVDKNGNPVKDKDGNPVEIGGESGNTTVTDPDSGKTTVVDKNGNPVIGKDGKPITIDTNAGKPNVGTNSGKDVAGNKGGLAATGSDAGLLGLMALSLTALGALVVARKRRDSAR